MAKIFLDTNIFIDIFDRRKEIVNDLKGHSLYISPLSIHIFYYSYRLKIPNNVSKKFKAFNQVTLTKDLTYKALEGPTSDLEDNIQLHSAAEADCKYFLTNDKKMLKMKFFGKCKITNKLA